MTHQAFYLFSRFRQQASRTSTLAPMILSCFLLSACNPELLEDGKANQPIPSKLKSEIKKIGSTERAPIYIRIFKQESVLEAWKEREDGTYALLKTYSICAYSGTIGPKKKEGDRQAPEGFYAITPGQMNPRSSYYLSFNLGYPNKFDRSYGRTGAHLMVHGSCSSRGCYAMEDAPISEIYALGREAFNGGQRSFKVHAFPFRMTPENMARVRKHEHFGFWKNIKEGYDHFQITKKPPAVEVCDRTYVFNPQGGGRFDAKGACPDYSINPTLQASLQKLAAEEDVRFQQAIVQIEEDKKVKLAKANDAMIDAQLDLLERKRLIAEGKNPDGFIAGLISGNPAPAQSAAPQSDAAGASLVQKSQSQTQTQPSGGFFSRITSSMPDLFTKPPKLLPIPIEEAGEAATITVLPKARK